ncbi:chromosome partitioning protein ParB [Salmonella enterica]|nr:chromosome partitioning protein ParB [Salmonella enterica]
MSVTESKAKPAGKTSRKAKKAAIASDNVLSAVLEQIEEQHVPLSALVKSPMNVRIVPYSAEASANWRIPLKGLDCSRIWLFTLSLTACTA